MPKPKIEGTQAEAPVEAPQEQVVETAAAPDPAIVAERAAGRATELAALQEKMGIKQPIEGAESSVAETAENDPLAGLTADDYKAKLSNLKPGVEHAVFMAHENEAKRVEGALMDGALAGTLDDVQKQALAERLVLRGLVRLDDPLSESLSGRLWMYEPDKFRKNLLGSEQFKEIVTSINPKFGDELEQYHDRRKSKGYARDGSFVGEGA